MANLRADNLTGTGGRNAIDGSVYFRGYIDGTNSDWLQTADLDDYDMGTGDFTFECWIKVAKNQGDYAGIFGMYDYDAAGILIQIKNTGVIRLVNPSGSFDHSGSTVLWGANGAIGDWQHIAVARSGSTLKAFINGIQEISTTYSTAIDFANGGGAVIGVTDIVDHEGDLNLRGYISNLRLIKGSALYTTAFTPPTEKLTVVDGTVLLCCQDSDDATQEATGKTISAHGGTLPSGDSNIIRNGDFSNGTTAWYGDSGAGVSASGGVATVTNGGGDYLFAIAQKSVCRIGGKYRIRGTIVPTMSTSTYQFRVRAGGSAVSWKIESGLTSGSSYDFDTGEVTADGTVLEIGSGNLANNSLTQFTLQNVVVTAIDPPKQINNIPSVGVDEGVTFGGDTKHNTLGHMYFPTGDTSQRGRGRGVFGGGYTAPANTNVIEYFEIQSGGKAQDFGDLNNAKQGVSALSSSVRGLFAGGGPSSEINTIDYVTLATTSNATDFGDLTAARKFAAPASNSTRGVYAGGETPTIVNTIDYVTIATVGNAADFGDLATVSSNFGGCSSATRGVFGGGDPGINVIEYVTIATTGNATDFGDLTAARRGLDACSSSTRGLFAGGLPGAQNTIDYITIASAGNAADFGDLRNVMWLMSATSSHTRGVWAGGYNPSSNVTFDTMDSTEIATLGNAVQFGTLISKRRSTNGGTSDCHGGLS